MRSLDGRRCRRQTRRQATLNTSPRCGTKYHVDFVIVIRGERGGRHPGITPDIAQTFLNQAQGRTSSHWVDHAWGKREIYPYLDSGGPSVAPCQLPPPARPVRGMASFQARQGRSASWRCRAAPSWTPWSDPVLCAAVHVLLDNLRPKTRVLFIDFHAEATSEKQAFGWYVDGRASAVVGTHTHVQTADERILPGGTAYLTDVGMTGAGPFRHRNEL